MIRRLCVIGVGLIGGSLARAIRKAGAVEEIVGCGRSTANLERAVELGVIDRYETSPAAAVEGADMVLVAVPLGNMAGVFEAIRDHLADDAVLTDAGSAKQSVIEDIRRVYGEVPASFVPGHPIAGTENSGVEASFAELYVDRRVILTPLTTTSDEAITRVEQMWQQAGAEVSRMDAVHHDEVLAATSHLPHVLAYALVDRLSQMGERDEIFQYAAGGFRDFTRIASSDPVMWRDICLANADALDKVLTAYMDEIAELHEALQKKDGDKLLDVFSKAKAARDRHCEK
jgi:prephenate dehydrogenase